MYIELQHFKINLSSLCGVISAGMRQKHLTLRSRGNYEIAARARPAYLLWAYSSSHDDKSTFEGTCPYCFQLLVQDKSRKCASNPSPNWHPEYRNFWIEKQEIIHSVLKKQKFWKSTKTPKVCCWLLVKHANRTVKHHGKSRSFLSAVKSNPTTPMSKLSLKNPERKTFSSSANLNHMYVWFQRQEPSIDFQNTCIWQSTSICSSKHARKQKKKHFSRLKCCLVRVNPKRIQRWIFRNFLSSFCKR